MTSQSVLALLLLLSVLISCGGQESKPEKRKAERVFDVITVKAKKEQHHIEYTTSGYVEAVHRLRVKPEISGKVTEIFAEEGSPVRVGTPLLKIEDSLYRESYREALWKLKEAQEELNRQRAVYERRKKLFEKELISKEEFEQASTKYSALKARVKSLKALLEKKKIELNKTTLYSPIEGYIQKRFVEKGEYVTPQRDTYEIVATSPVRVVFSIPQELLGSLRRNESVKIRWEGKEIESGIAYISPSADRNRLFTVKTSHIKENLKPGSYVDVSFKYREVKAVKVPEQALQLSQRQSFVWVVRNSRAMKIPVRVISHEEGMVLVDGDFNEQDRIVVEGLMFLYEGAQVKER